MNKPFVIIFGGAIAFILLSLYAVTVGYMIQEIVSCTDPSCKKEFSEGMIYVVTTVGGLVSALVISKLAITKPGENPAIISMTESADGSGEKTVNKPATIMAFLYLMVWILTGFAALIIGVMVYPDANSTISDIGTTWLGLAVAAGYTYFGISP
jgi:hypothetical protein